MMSDTKITKSINKLLNWSWCGFIQWYTEIYKSQWKYILLSNYKGHYEYLFISIIGNRQGWTILIPLKLTMWSIDINVFRLKKP